MWLSCSAFMSQYFRVYSPISFGQKSDKKGLFIRKYVPELSGYPDKFIYSPWLAPSSVQAQAKCIIGEDYPEPIVDDKASKEFCIASIKRAYEANIHGDDERVLNGTAKEYLQSFGDIQVSNGNNTGGKRKRKEEIQDEKQGLKQQKLAF